MPKPKVLIRAPQEPERRTAALMTGRYLMTVHPDAHDEVSAKLDETGIKQAVPLPQAAAAKPLPDGMFIPLKDIGVSLVDPTDAQEDELHSLAEREDGVLALEPERIVRAVGNTQDYVRGWRDAVDAFSGKLLEQTAPSAAMAAEAVVAATATWGLIATKVADSSLSGDGIRIAILDTGLDVTHPDFAGRQIVTKNFVGDNMPFHDGVGHGTHCAGTAAGPLHPAQGLRYGIAYQAQIYAGRVLDDTGHGGDFNILQGIQWAIEQKCDIVSLSLEAPWMPGNPAYNSAYEAAAQQALQAGCLLIVAAGNEADNSIYTGAVGSPGNSPSVLTVAAVDQTMATASFSNRVQPGAPGVKGPDLAGPGVGIYSAWLMSDGRYNTISGTSMATPHVAGVAALFAQANPGTRGQALKDMLISHCLALANGAARQGEIGRGLVQALGNPAVAAQLVGTGAPVRATRRRSKAAK
jgi:subtilisin family serine protease